ncbi:MULTISPECIES: DUF6088 family protein [unclassified Pseudomonas]|uniref:DUF6088 family protein n=1 Tax=Pseudomonas sp. BGr12 TaxID=2936269 RepID=UPI003339AF54
MMSVSTAVFKRVQRFPKGVPFPSERLSGLGSPNAVRKALSFLVKKGHLRRLLPGVYQRPCFHPVIGEILPAAESVVKAIALARGEQLQIHGAEALRAFRLSTQMQMVATYYTNRSTREIRVGNSRVRLIHAPRSLLQHFGTTVGIAVSALYYLKDQEANRASLDAIASRLSSSDLEKLKLCHLPDWAAKMIIQGE